MSPSILVFNQSIIMFLLMTVGYFLYKKKFISDVGSKEMANILLRIVIPVVIIRSYIVEYSFQQSLNLWTAMLYSMICAVVAIGISALVFGKRNRVLNFACTFCNAGFFGIPMVQSVFGDEAVFYVASFAAIMGVLQWTYGVFVLRDNSDAVKLANILKNPMTISLVLGLLIYFSRIPVPDLVVKTLTTIGGVNTPLAMFVLGTYLAKTDIKQMLKDRGVYLACAVRLILIPFAGYLALAFLPIRNMEVMLTILIAAAAPVGVNVTIFSAIFDGDVKQATHAVCLSTLLSIVSIPIYLSIIQTMML